VKSGSPEKAKSVQMKQTSINALIYKNYLKSALIPIFILEAALLLLYFGINFYISEKNQVTLLNEATTNIQGIASREVATINQQLKEIADLSIIMQQDHQSFFSHPDFCFTPNAQPDFAYHENGAFFKTKDNGGSSLYYASTTRIGAAERHKARCSESLDLLLKSIVDTSPIVTQAYLNTWDDMNRLYPFMEDAPRQYGSALNTEGYNFYYEADAEHNPGRNPVWTCAYLDPAGQGWMASSIIPIYNGDFLEGVSGLDVTINSFVQHILNLRFPWDAATLMVDKTGTILAMQKRAEEIFQLQELGSHAYSESIKKTIEKPENFNLLNNPDRALADQFSKLFASKAHIAAIHIAGVDYLVSQEIVTETGWRMLTLIDKAKVFAPITSLKELSNKLGIGAIATVVLFYLLFFFFLLKKSKKMTALIATPIKKLSRVTQQLETHLKSDQLDPSGILEIDALAENFNTMSLELEHRTQDLILTRDRADDANKAKSEFLANMSHEIRTPMHGIMGMTSLTLKTELSDKQRRYLDIVQSSAEHLKCILDDILDFSKVEAGKMELTEQPFVVNDVIRHSINIIKPAAKEKSVTLSVQVDKETPQALIGDPVRLGQILINLLNNAVKFSEPAGKVILKVATEEKSATDVLLKVAVEDKGIGIAPKHLEKLFQSFSQVDGSSTRKHGGTGLGLAISKRLVKLMRGEISVDSAEGHGSTFSFSVPLKRTEIPEDIPERKEPGPIQ
jgi:signal transduction histidine kinase